MEHNPGGALKPGTADPTGTEQIRAAGQACGLRFLGHLIVAGNRWRAI